LSVSVGARGLPAPHSNGAAALLWIGGGPALLVGLAVGDGSAMFLGMLGALIAATVIVMALARPFAGYLVLAASAIFLPVVVLFSHSRGLNPFDLLLAPLMVTAWFGTARDAAAAEDARVVSGAEADILGAARSFSRAVVIFYALAALSVVVIVLDGRTGQAVATILGLVRTWQALLLFPLGLYWLRDEARIRRAIGAMLAAGGLFVVVNSVFIVAGRTKRAGLTWFLNQPEWPIGGQNDAGVALILLAALVLVRQGVRPRFGNLVMLGLALVMLVMTQSRSGLLALLTFTLFSLPRARWGLVLGAAVMIAAALPLVPQEYWGRLGRTLTMERGSFEAYTSLVRLLHWEAALAAFLDHPIFGVGYLAFGSVSSQYSHMRLIMGPAESFYLEIAAGMGTVGLVAIGIVFVRFFRLARVVARLTPPHTWGGALARYHTPLLLALLVANLTGETLIGMTNLAQLAVWTALLVSAGRIAARRDGPVPAA
jgi:O-antigen ligase